MESAASNVLDSRKREVVADGLTLCHGAQLAIVTTRQEESRKKRRSTWGGQKTEGAHVPGNLL